MLPEADVIVVGTVREWCLCCVAGLGESSTGEVQRLRKFCHRSCWVFAVPCRSECSTGNKFGTSWTCDIQIFRESTVDGSTVVLTWKNRCSGGSDHQHHRNSPYLISQHDCQNKDKERKDPTKNCERRKWGEKVKLILIVIGLNDLIPQIMWQGVKLLASCFLLINLTISLLPLSCCANTASNSASCCNAKFGTRTSRVSIESCSQKYLPDHQVTKYSMRYGRLIGNLTWTRKVNFSATWQEVKSVVSLNSSAAI